ncbi:MAG: YceI family protein [Thermoanaerobaculia bacterium]
MTKNLTRVLALVGASAFASLSLQAADTYTIDKSHSEATFKVRHLVSKVQGRFTDFNGTVEIDAAKPEASAVAFNIVTASINTDNDGRDKHLKTADFFDAEKFPQITFKSSKVVGAGKDRYHVTGPLTMHGVTKEVTLPVTFLGFAKDPWGGERAGFETSITLDRKEYGISWNKALDAGGALLGDDVTVTISLETVKKKAEAPKAAAK